MKGQTIGKTMPHGYAGSYSRQPDMVVDTHPLGGKSSVVFGQAVKYASDGSVEFFGTSSTAEEFVGVAVREVKSSINFLNQNAGQYVPGEAVSVMKRGCVNVICQRGTPTLAGNVYVRIEKNDIYPNAVVGGFEATADDAKTVELPNAQWRGVADAAGVAEIRILTINKA